MLLNNPLIRRYRYSLMRPRQFWIYMSIYISLVALLLFINYTIYKYQMEYETLTSLFESIYYQFIVLQVLVLWIWGSFNSSSAIKEEIVEKSYDFFRMLPIPARDKASGILIGKNLVVLLLAAINFLLLLLFGLFGQVNYFLLLQTFLLLLSVAVLLNSMALLSSINSTGKRRKGSIAGFILLGFFLGPVIINGLVEFAQAKNLETTTATFFTLKIPVLVLISLIVLYFGCWTIKGILRKFTHEDEPLFSRLGAFIFMLGYEFVVLGLFYKHLSFGSVVNNYCWLTALMPVLAVPMASVRTFERYLEYSGLMLIGSETTPKILRLFLHSNLFLGLALFAIWAVFSVVTTTIADVNVGQHLITIAVILSFYIFLILLLELYVVYKPLAPKAGILLAFIVAVYSILPPILSAIFESETLYMYSPFGFIAGTWGISDYGLDTIVAIVVTNLFLCFIPAVLVLKRHFDVLITREIM